MVVLLVPKGNGHCKHGAAVTLMKNVRRQKPIQRIRNLNVNCVPKTFTHLSFFRNNLLQPVLVQVKAKRSQQFRIGFKQKYFKTQTHLQFKTLHYIQLPQQRRKIWTVTCGENHARYVDAYYTLIQIQIYCTHSKKTHLFVYSSKDYKLVQVDYDEDFI